MPGKPAARLTDQTVHGLPAFPGIGSITVIIGKLPAWRVIDDTHICPLPIAPPAPAPHGPEKCYMGSTTVLINNRMACRSGDILQGSGPPNSFAKGELTVLIGDVGFGMARADNRSAYAAAMRKIYDNWDSMTPEERRRAMEDALNNSLPNHMPRLRLSMEPLASDLNGQLDFQNWEVEVNRSMLEGDMTEEQFAEMSNTIYHEGRHGEQWYNAAQYRANEGDSAEEISSGMGVPQRVGEHAVNNPAEEGTSENAMGESVYNSVYGDRAAHREDVYDDMDTGEAGSYDRYQALPEEEDAFRQGDAAENDFRNTP